MRNKNTMIKGALAGVTGIALLAGGFGSFALWSSAQYLPGGNVQTGVLELRNTGTTATLNGEAVSDPTSIKMVPGDEVVFTGDYWILAEGDNLAAELVYDTHATPDAALAEEMVVDSVVTLDGVAVNSGTPITAAHDRSTVAIRTVLTLPESSTNESQAGTVSVGGMISVNQVIPVEPVV